MAFLDSRKTILSASLLIAIVIIVGAYILSGHTGSTTLVNAGSTDNLLKAYAAKDSDSDGLPDWEEALYGTDPNNAHSVRADLTDGDAVAKGLATAHYGGVATTATTTPGIVASDIPGNNATPGSLTDQFSKLFFNNYVVSRGDTKPTAAQMQTFVQGAIGDLLKTRTQIDAFSASQIKVSGTGSTALKSYAIQVEQAFKQHRANVPYHADVYFADAVERNDKTAIAHLKTISTSYLDTAKALVAVSVPQEMAQAHLALVNATARFGATVGDLASIDTDPIRGMLGLGSADKDSANFTKTIISVGHLFTEGGVMFQPSEPGYGFYKTATALSEATSTTP